MNFVTLASGGGQTNGWLSIVMLIGMVVLMYFMLIRPQRKQQKKEKEMRDNLQIGDEIVTIGGICGRVVSLKEDSLVIESSGDRTKIQMQRSSISQNLTIHE